MDNIELAGTSCNVRADMADACEKLSRDAINALPLFHYEGPVSFARTTEEVEDALFRLSGETLLGFDTETPPSFHKGKSHPPALVQLAGATEVVLFPLKWQPFGPALIRLFENPGIVKTGVAVHDDMRFLATLSHFSPKSVVDLSEIARRNGVENRGLRGLAAAFLGVRISKGERCSNWGNMNLTARQVRYAATDAWVSRGVYLAMLEAGLDMSADSPPASVRKDRTPSSCIRRRSRCSRRVQGKA